MVVVASVVTALVLSSAPVVLPHEVKENMDAVIENIKITTCFFIGLNLSTECYYSMVTLDQFPLGSSSCAYPVSTPVSGVPGLPWAGI